MPVTHQSAPGPKRLQWGWDSLDLAEPNECERTFCDSDVYGSQSQSKTFLYSLLTVRHAGRGSLAARALAPRDARLAAGARDGRGGGAPVRRLRRVAPAPARHVRQVAEARRRRPRPTTRCGRKHENTRSLCVGFGAANTTQTPESLRTPCFSSMRNWTAAVPRWVNDGSSCHSCGEGDFNSIQPWQTQNLEVGQSPGSPGRGTHAETATRRSGSEAGCAPGTARCSGSSSAALQSQGAPITNRRAAERDHEPETRISEAGCGESETLTGFNRVSSYQ